MIETKLYAKNKHREQTVDIAKNISLILFCPSTIVRNWRNFIPAHNGTDDCFLQRTCPSQSFVIVMSSLRWVHNRSGLQYFCEVAFLCRLGIPSHSCLWKWVMRWECVQTGLVLLKVVYVRIQSLHSCVSL